MKKKLLLILAVVILLIIGIVAGFFIINRFLDIQKANKLSHSSVESVYINKVEDFHDRELVDKAFRFLPDELKGVLDYSIIPKVLKVDKGVMVGSYVGNKFPDGLYRVMFTADPMLFMDAAHNIIIVAIDLKDEDKMMILPID